MLSNLHSDRETAKLINSVMYNSLNPTVHHKVHNAEPLALKLRDGKVNKLSDAELTLTNSHSVCPSQKVQYSLICTQTGWGRSQCTWRCTAHFYGCSPSGICREHRRPPQRCWSSVWKQPKITKYTIQTQVKVEWRGGWGGEGGILFLSLSFFILISSKWGFICSFFSLLIF